MDDFNLKQAVEDKLTQNVKSLEKEIEKMQNRTMYLKYQKVWMEKFMQN
jgi:hypothetical protein